MRSAPLSLQDAVLAKARASALAISRRAVRTLVQVPAQSFLLCAAQAAAQASASPVSLGAVSAPGPSFVVLPSVLLRAGRLLRLPYLLVCSGATRRPIARFCSSCG